MKNSKLFNLAKYLCRILSRLMIFLYYFIPISKMGEIKRFSLRLHGCKVGKNTSLSPGLFILRGENIKIGYSCNIGVACRLIDICRIEIGDEVLISHNVTIISGTHIADKIRSPIQGDVIIGSGVWIGASVTIVGPATIGDGAIIGANSFVRGNVPPKAIFAGSPAKIIHNEEYVL